MAGTLSAFLILGLMYAGYGLASPDDFNESPQLIALLADYVQRLLPIGLLSGIEPEFVPVGRISLLVYQCVGPVFWIIALLCAWDCLRDRSMVNDASRHRVDEIILLAANPCRS